MTKPLTCLQRLERAALLSAQGNTDVALLMSALRLYRRAVEHALGRRYLDGECDSATLCSLEVAVERIESGEDLGLDENEYANLA